MATRWVRYVADNESFGRFILSDQIRKPVVEVATKIAERAGELSPKRKSRGTVDPNPLSESFRVKPEAGVIKVGRNVRVKVEVYSESRAAAPMEFGNKRVRGHRTLGRAGAEYGDFHSGKREL